MNGREDLTVQSADRKLIFIVKKLVSAKEQKNNVQPATWDAKALTDLVLERHREYQRKNRAAVQSSIENILQNRLHEYNPASSSANSHKNNLKRKYNNQTAGPTDDTNDPSESQSDLEYEQAAQQEERLREQWIATSPAFGGTSMLNAGLRSRYVSMQKERDANDTQTLGSTNPTDAPDHPIHKTVPETSAQNSNTSSMAVVAPKKKKSKSSKMQPTSSTSTPSSLFTPTPRPKERYSDLGGMSNILTQIRQLIEYPLMHPELFQHLGIDPPRGILLRGPPGTGKTHLANAIAGQLNVTFFRISSPELVGGISGESESRIRDLFTAASLAAPSIVFLDELDAIAPKRGDGTGSSGGGGAGGASRGMEKRVVAQLLTSLDALTPENNVNQAPVMVIGATNRPDAIDPALRRAGRFDREILLGVPDEEARERILRVMTTPRMRLAGDFDFKLLARKTPGFVGADIRSLTKEAAVAAINRIFKTMLIGDEGEGLVQKQLLLSNHGLVDDVKTTADPTQNGIDSDVDTVQPFTPLQMEPLFVTMDDFLEALPHVQPSSKREGFATIPDVSWDNIGALQAIREELVLSVLEPIQHPERFIALGIPLPAGVLLYGPPGCGKTLLAKAIANESGANFISVKGPELLDKYVGESERAVRVVFERARSSSPCIVFFDELDSLCPRRGTDSSSGGGVTERVVNQLLTEMDGLDSRRSVFVIAATNRPELIDPAMLRPGRLDKMLYVPLPLPEDRLSILTALSRTVKLSGDVDLKLIAHDTRADGYSGADCAALLREAGLAVLRDLPRTTTNAVADGLLPVEETLQITSKHFDYAFAHVLPSVGKKDKANYEKIRERMARARARDGEAVD